MKKHIPFDALGHADHGWLNARHHFSFANYYDPTRMGFGAIRVINDDRIAPGTGFPPHPHNDMEIITYVRSGAIHHKDNLGNSGTTRAGDVQVMSAGAGIAHAEYADEREPTTLYQIWIQTKERGIKPRWEQTVFPKEPVSGALRLLASGRAEDDGKGALYIHQHAAIRGGRLAGGASVSVPGAKTYLLVSEGTVNVGDLTLRKGDGLELTDEPDTALTAVTEAEVLAIDVAGAVPG